MDYKGERPRQLALAATIEEVKRFEAVKRYHKRKFEERIHEELERDRAKRKQNNNENKGDT